MPTMQKRQPRLKESCDSCSAAKVRCTKDKPNCLRCAQKGYECTYSHSRRAGRRNMNASRPTNPSNINRHSRAPSSDTSSWPESHPSPEYSDDGASEVFDTMWNSPPAPTSAPDFPILQQMWDEEMYGLQCNQFDQSMSFLPAAASLPATAPLAAAPLIADARMLSASPQPFQTIPTSIPMQPFLETMPADLLAAPQLSRASSAMTRDSSTSRASTLSTVSSSHADSVHEELTNLTSFAEAMEKKFDGVVKTRLQFRDVSNDFGVPLDSFDAMQEKIGGVPGQPGIVPAPDASELAFYHQLAEMKRRLRWLKEDFGKMVNQPTVNAKAVMA